MPPLSLGASGAELRAVRVSAVPALSRCLRVPPRNPSRKGTLDNRSCLSRPRRARNYGTFEVIFFSLANTDPQQTASLLGGFSVVVPPPTQAQCVTDVVEAWCWMGSQVPSIAACKLEGGDLEDQELEIFM